MKTKSITIIIAIIIICVGLLGCIEENKPNGNQQNHDYANDAEKFVGTWNTSNPIQWHIKPHFIFYENGSFTVQDYGGTYEVDDGLLQLYWEDGVNIYNYSYVFLDDNTVRLTYINSGDEGLYKRQ